LNFQKLIVIGLGIIANVLLIGHLQKQIEDVQREKTQQTINAYNTKLYPDDLERRMRRIQSRFDEVPDRYSGELEERTFPVVNKRIRSNRGA